MANNMFSVYATNMDTDSSSSETEEPRLRIVATKFYDDESGRVNISGWLSHHTCGKVFRFSIADHKSRRRWIHMVDFSPTNKEPLRVEIDRSSVHSLVSVTAELLAEEDGSCDKRDARQFSVESESSCFAILTSGNRELDLILPLLRGLRTSDEIDERKPEPPQTIEVNIQRESFRTAHLVFDRHIQTVKRWQVTLSRKGEDFSTRVFVRPVRKRPTKFQLPVEFEAGQVYLVHVEGLKSSSGRILCEGSTDFRAELTPTDLQNLQIRAVHYVGGPHSSSAPCRVLYRNKPRKYFKDIKQNHKGIMKVYIKDASGDPGSPINGRINGLFFMASVKPGSKTGEPDPRSAFGDTRLRIPAQEFFEATHNLYFADFYCMKTEKKHYVTLVWTKPETDVDQFCADHLVKLDVRNPTGNPFLFFDAGGELRVSASKKLSVEVLITEDVDIRKYKLQHPIKTIGKGHSTKAGRPKNPNCEKCNLYA